MNITLCDSCGARIRMTDPAYSVGGAAYGAPCGPHPNRSFVLCATCYDKITLASTEFKRAEEAKEKNGTR